MSTDMRLVITLVRAGNGNWSYTAGDSRRQLDPVQGVGCATAEQALKEALWDVGYASVKEDPAGEA